MLTPGEGVPVQQSPASKEGELLAECDQSSDNHKLHLSMQDHRLPHNDINLVVTGARMVAVVCWGCLQEQRNLVSEWMSLGCCVA